MNIDDPIVHHTSAIPPAVTSIDRNVRVPSSLTKTSHLLKSIQYLSHLKNTNKFRIVNSKHQLQKSILTYERIHFTFDATATFDEA